MVLSPQRTLPRPLTPAQRDHKLARARALDQQIAEVARRRKKSDAGLAYRLLKFAEEGLPGMFGFADVGVYAVAKGYLDSEREGS
jgi:hypothetical protein